MSAGESTRSTQPAAMALRGIESCAKMIPALGLDRFETQRAVARGAGEYHADGPVMALLRQ